MSKLIHTKVNQVNISPHINNYSTRGIIHDTRKISNDPTCGRVRKSILITLLAVMGSCPLSCGILSTANNSAHAVGSEVHFGVNVPDVPVLEIILKDGNDEIIESGTEMDVTPTMAYAGFNTADVNVTVGTSSNAGYNLKMLVDNSSVVSQNNLSGINSNALVSAEGNTIETLGENPETPFTCSAATAQTCNFTVNSWGYRLSTDAENTYKAVPQAETELLNYTDGATNGVTTSLGFGVRANAKQAGGYYETTLNFIATANPETTISMLTHMQDFAVLSDHELEDVVRSMNEGQSYTLVDSRDNASESYEIAKLADGNVWMLENLRLGKDSTINLTPSDTNIASNYTLPTSGTAYFDTTNGYTNAAINISKKTEVGSGSWKYGVYYNYCAASAGTICAASNQNNDDASYDICPAGWRMPTGGASGEYRALTTALTGTSTGNMTGDNYTTVVNTLHLPLSGRFYNVSPTNQGYDGHFWSSTRNDGNHMYDLELSTSTVSPESSYARFYGYSVRCVLKTDPVERAGITTMQDFASMNKSAKTRLVAAMPEGKSYTLTDTRDNNTYSVAKLADGNVWLQDNLQLDIAANKDNITSTNTNANNDVLTCLKSGCSDSTTYSQAAAANTNKDNWSGDIRYTQAMYNTEYADYDADYGNGTHKSGYYYNYCAASAGSYCYAVNSAPSKTNATQDICPAGWQMPAADTSTYGYQKLYEAYGSRAAFKNALRAGLSGSFNGGIVNQGSWGIFWASTYSGDNTMRYLSVGASSVSSQGNGSRVVGVSVRCVLKTE